MSCTKPSCGRSAIARGSTFTYQEGVVNVGQDSVFGNDMIDLSQLNDICFLESLHCIKLSALFVLRENDSSKGTYYY